MLIGKLSQSLEHDYYPDSLKQIIEHLLSLPLDRLETGKHKIPHFKDSEAWLVILEYQTEAEKNFQPEVHKYYSDLQIVISGKEKMAWCMDTGDFKPDGSYIEERDIQYYQRDGMEINYFSAKEGFFYLFTPSVVHFTNILDSQVSKVRKLVVKIHNDILLG